MRSADFGTGFTPNTLITCKDLVRVSQYEELLRVQSLDVPLSSVGTAISRHMPHVGDQAVLCKYEIEFESFLFVVMLWLY